MGEIGEKDILAAAVEDEPVATAAVIGARNNEKVTTMVVTFSDGFVVRVQVLVADEYRLIEALRAAAQHELVVGKTANGHPMLVSSAIRLVTFDHPEED